MPPPEDAFSDDGDGPATFDLTPIGKDKGMRVITIAGEKGEGKTTQALGAPGTIAAVTWDRKTGIIHDTFWKSDPRISVYDGVRYYGEDATSKSEIPRAAAKNFAYVMKLLTGPIKDAKPDWIFHDGLEILHQICEQKMRHENSLGATQGIANPNIWKERAYNVRAIHHASLAAAKKGVIYTTYMEFKEELINDGQTVKGKKVPKWVDAVKYETDITVHVYRQVDRAGKGRHFAEVISSKDPSFLRDGLVLEVSGGKSIFSATHAPMPVSEPAPATVGTTATPVTGTKSVTDDVFS